MQEMVELQQAGVVLEELHHQIIFLAQQEYLNLLLGKLVLGKPLLLQLLQQLFFLVVLEVVINQPQVGTLRVIMDTQQ